MRIKCGCGAVPCWWYAPSGARDLQQRVFCADCVPRGGDAIPGWPDEERCDIWGNPADAEYHEWPNPDAYCYNTPGYWLWIDVLDPKRRVLPDCEYWFVGYHKRKWQWLKKKK